MDSASAPPAWRLAAALAVAVVFCAVVAWGLIVPGPFDWALHDARAYQGGIEVAALLLGLAALQGLPAPRWRLGACLLLAALYLRRHAVDLPLLLCLGYLEFTLALGAALGRCAGVARPAGTPDYLRSFVLGLAGWSVAAWALSACGYGTPTALRLLSVALLPFALWARARPLSLQLYARSRELPWLQRAALALLAGWMLVLFARTNTVFSFDALWYGYRAQYVLSADGSAFAPLGLVSPVYYFPKLYEVYLLPLSALGDTSVLSGMSVLLAGLLALAADQLLQRIGVSAITPRLALAALVLTLPAIANPALEPKPDIVCALFLLLCWLYGGDWLQRRDAASLAWLLACVLLAFSCKLIAVPFLGLLLPALLAGLALRRWPAAAVARDADGAALRCAVLAATLAVLAAAFVVARTWLLAGVPTIGPDPLFKVWNLLGLELREPVGTLSWALPQQWQDLPWLALDWLLRPQRLDHIVISWTGNVWLWLPLAAALLQPAATAAPATARAHRYAALALIAAGLILALAFGHHTRGGDGNYFIAALVPALALGLAYAWRRCAAASRARQALLAGCAVFAGFQAVYAFVSAGWAPGTRPLDLVLDRSPRDAHKLARAIVVQAGLGPVDDYLNMQPGVARVVGCAPFEAAMRLQARFEDIPSIAQSRPEYTVDLAALQHYMQRFGIAYLLLPRPEAGSPAAGQLLYGCTPHDAPPPGTERVVETDRFQLLRVRPALAPPR